MDTIDISNALIQRDVVDKFVTMRLRLNLVDLVHKIYPDIYFIYITIDAKVNTVVYIWMLKAVYGIMKVVLKFILILSWISSREVSS